MRLKFSLWSVMLLLLFMISCSKNETYETKTAESNGYSYEYVTNDPLKVRIYTLKNGLKVYLSRYDVEPRIHTQIAVREGGQNHPARATGLAHSLDYIMCNGTPVFGRQDGSKEKIV